MPAPGSAGARNIVTKQRAKTAKRAIPPPPFGLEQETVNNLFLLQKRGIEHGGLVLKSGKLADVRVGHPSSVGIDIVVDDAAYDFHTHPTGSVSSGDFGSKAINKREARCALEAAQTRYSTISPEDTFIAIQYRPAIGKMPSLMISDGAITRYQLVDKGKYDAFVKTVKKDKFGQDFEDYIQEALDDRFTFIQNRHVRAKFDDQKFSECDSKDAWRLRKKAWYGFLNGIGMEVVSEPAGFDPALDRKMLARREKMEK